MRTINYHRQHGGNVARVTDEQAAEEVSGERATYCPKNWWKAAREKEADQ